MPIGLVWLSFISFVAVLAVVVCLVMFFLVSRSRAPEALERLGAMEKTEDGFALSEMDLSLRREGDIFGDRQHGASPLKLVNVVRDKAVIEAAYRDARYFRGRCSNG